MSVCFEGKGRWCVTDDKLTPKQRRFIDEYLIDLNATQAAIRSGYSKRSASVIGARVLASSNVRAELERRQAQLRKKLEITHEKILQELAAIAFASGADYVSVERTDSRDTVRVIPTVELSPEKLPAIAAMKANQYGVELKLYDKIKALELLGKHLGTFENGGNADLQAENNLFEAIRACAGEIDGMMNRSGEQADGRSDESEGGDDL